MSNLTLKSNDIKSKYSLHEENKAYFRIVFGIVISFTTFIIIINDFHKSPISHFSVNYSHDLIDV